MQAILAIAHSTFRESVRSKALYLALFFAALLVLATTLFGTVTVGDQIKVIKDFGLFAISLTSICYVVIAGSSLLHKELMRKTIYSILSKPVSRYQVILGKFLGMIATSSTMLILMGVALSGYVALFEKRIDTLLLQAYLFSLLELFILCGATIFFSSIVVTPLLAGLFTFALFLAGRSTEYLLYFLDNGAVQGISRTLLTLLYWGLPHLTLLTRAHAVVYGNGVSEQFALYAVLYTIGYTSVLLTLSIGFFQRRDFN